MTEGKPVLRRSAAAILRSARQEPLQVDGNPTSPHLLPSGDVAIPRDFWARYPQGIGAEFNDLLELCSGFRIGSYEVSFTDHHFQGFDGLLNDWLELTQDGYGNFWVLEILPNAEMGSVWFVCHDPPVMILVASDLGSFIDLVVDVFRKKKRCEPNAFAVSHDAAMRVWSANRPNTPARECDKSQDIELREFARTLSPGSVILDMRAFHPGDGIICDALSPMHPVKLCPTNPLLRAAKT